MSWDLLAGILTGLLVAATPLTRSSYHADRDFAAMQSARAAQLAQISGNAQT